MMKRNKEVLKNQLEELQRTVERLKSENFQLREIIDNVPGDVYWKNLQGVWLGVNARGSASLQKMGFSFKPEDIIGKTDEQLFGEATAKIFRENDLEVIQGQKEISKEESATFVTGEKIVQISIKRPLYDENKKVTGIIGNTVDITYLKKIENDLIVAKEKAETANKAKTEFLANMSHDMKTPLAGIVTSADVIAYDQNSPERIRQFAAIISASGKQLESFFTSCLELSKMEMEEWVSNTSVFSIKKLLNDIYTLFLPKAMSNNLVLKVEYDETLPEMIEGHRDSLYRVLLNLVGNAIKFTEKGSVTLCTKLLNNTDEKQVTVEFQIKDTGIGIPEDKHQVIFEKLRRLKPSYESKIEGSGMGLYIADQYIKRMNGTIRVESRVGEGSTFTVRLPLKVSFDKIATLPSTLPSVEVAKLHDPFGIKTLDNKISNNISKIGNAKDVPCILVVEDTDIIQLVTKTLLNEAGFSVDIASTGEEALEMFEPSKYGLIYMDVGLPKMNGFETAKAIRTKEQVAKAAALTPIIALTGHGAVDVQAFCGDAGMQGVISKPLSREQAEMVWKHFKDDANVSIPGLTLLTNTPLEPSNSNSLDVDATIKTIGVKDIALTLIATFVEDLKN